MNPTLRNVGAVIVGLIFGGLVNGLIIFLSPFLIPPPPGADFTTPEGLEASAGLMEPIHFLMPFLAHAVGTFVGAIVAAKLAATHKMRCALIIGVAFLIGGVMAVMTIPSPVWFILADLLLAYIPMAYLGGKLALPKNK